MDSSLTTRFKDIKDLINKMTCEDSTQIPLTYLIQALYPQAFKQFNENFKKEYTRGYIAGLADGKKSRKEIRKQKH